MNFKRKRVKGRSAKTYKEWHSDCGQYRITWRRQVAGVEVPPGYWACCRCVADQEYWGYAYHRRLYRTLKAAQKACEDAERLWRKFLSIEGRTTVSQVRELQAQSMVGSGQTAYSPMTDVPVWVVKEAHPQLLEILGVSDANTRRVSC